MGLIRKLSGAVGIAFLLASFLTGCGQLMTEQQSSAPAVSTSESSFTVDTSSEERSVPPESFDLPESSEQYESFDPPKYNEVYRAEDEPRLEDIRLPQIAEQGFSFLESDITLFLGKTATVLYEFKPVGAGDRRLTWSSSNESVVQVENGVLRAVGVGHAYVRAETVKGRKAECRVTVLPLGELTPLAELINRVMGDSAEGWQFACCDVDRDGQAELLARHADANGTAHTEVFCISNGTSMLQLQTGTNEEWAVWKRANSAETFLLVSFEQLLEDGGTRYVAAEVLPSKTGEETALTVRVMLQREVLPSQGTRYYIGQGEGLTACTQDAYSSFRTAYFNANREMPAGTVKWVSGDDPQKIADALS